jgi:phosphatidate cytidylyltransferase
MNEFLKRTLTAVLLVIGFVSIYYFLPPSTLPLCMGLIALYALIFEWPCLANNTWWLWLLTPLYPVLPFILLILLDRFFLVVLLLFVCSHDAGAYVIGKLFGRHTIMPRVSPKKTWEGFIGGSLIASILLGYIVYLWSSRVVTLSSFIVCVVCLNSAALVGDLWESYLKRRVGLKDSGNILPGHGGILDRFDSILCAVIVFYLLLYFL